MIKVYLDTNIFDYVILHDTKYGKACKEILSDVGKILVASCSMFVPIEILGSLSRIDVRSASKALDAFFALGINLIDIDERLILSAKNIMQKTNINGYDAVHAAAMKKENIKIIITENYKDFKKIPNIKIIRPLDYSKWKKIRDPIELIEGGLSHLRGKLTSVELQHEATKIWTEKSAHYKKK